MRAGLAAVLVLLVAPAAATADTWTPTGNVTSVRSTHTATRLANGKVLVAGGYKPATALATAELYDPATGTWSGTGSLGTARIDASATLLPNGKVLVAGGSNFSLSPIANYSTCELYDPATGAWSTTGVMGTGRKYHTATLLLTGRVLVAGGASTSSTCDSRTGMWRVSRFIPRRVDFELDKL